METSQGFEHDHLKNVNNALTCVYAGDILLVVYYNFTGSNPLYGLLYETDHIDERMTAIETVPRVWRFRTQISIAHMRRELETRAPEGKNKLPVLRQFLFEVSTHFIINQINRLYVNYTLLQ